MTDSLYKFYIKGNVHKEEIIIDGFLSTRETDGWKRMVICHIPDFCDKCSLRFTCFTHSCLDVSDDYYSFVNKYQKTNFRCSDLRCYLPYRVGYDEKPITNPEDNNCLFDFITVDDY